MLLDASTETAIMSWPHEVTGRARPTYESDAFCLSQMAKGDGAALEALYRRHRQTAHRFILRLVSSEAQAEELVGDVFIAAWQNAASYGGRSKPLTWILSIAHNKAVSCLRKRREVTGSIDVVAAALACPGESPDQAVVRSDSGAVLKRCIGKLSPDHRQVVDLIYFQEFSVTEAADRIGIPEATVKTRLFYARKKLAHLLEKNGVFEATYDA